MGLGVSLWSARTMSAPDLHEAPLRHSGARIASTIHRVDLIAARHERVLWAAAVIGLAGDVVLTIVGLNLGLTEGNPVMRWAISVGGPGALLIAKVIALSVGVTVRLWVPRHAALVPLGLAGPWLLAMAINALMIT